MIFLERKLKLATDKFIIFKYSEKWCFNTEACNLCLVVQYFKAKLCIRGVNCTQEIQSKLYNDNIHTNIIIMNDDLFVHNICLSLTTIFLALSCFDGYNHI